MLDFGQETIRGFAMRKKNKQLNIRIDSATRAKLKIMARNQNRTISQMICILIEKAYDAEFTRESKTRHGFTSVTGITVKDS